MSTLNAGTLNITGTLQLPSYNNAGRDVDFLAGGFVVRQESGYGYNYAGTRTHYMAFAEHPFIGTGSRSPTTAV